MTSSNKDFHDDLEQLKIESLQLTATLLELVSDGAKAVKKFARAKSSDIRERLINE